MSDRITVFHRETGRIKPYPRVDFGRDPIVIPPDHDWIMGGTDASVQRINPLTLEREDKLTIVPVVSFNMIEGLPEGSKIRLGIQRFTETRGRLVVRARWPEPMSAAVTHEDWLPWEGSLECGPADLGADEPEAVDLEQDWRKLRAGAYPPLAELADAIAKGDDAALDAYRAGCLAVKESIPKPEDLS